jgi:hypothetical protein
MYMTILLAAIILLLFGNVSSAQTHKMFPLKAGEAYHIEFVGMEGDFILVNPPRTDGWAVVNIQSGFRGTNLRSSENVGLNLSNAIVLEDLGDSASFAVQSNKDAIINDLNNLAANAYQYLMKQKAAGGGGYNGYAIDPNLVKNDNASFTATATSDTVSFTAVSSQGYGTVQCKLDQNGRTSGWTFSGKFQ